MPGAYPPEFRARAVRDKVMAHSVYGDLGWVCIAQPGPNSGAEVRSLLREAHDAARRRWERRQAN